MKYVGFYWTLPVGWLGIRDLPRDAKQAAKKSKTIRYQRTVVQDWVRSLNENEPTQGPRHELIDEVTYIDIRPDRPTHALLLDAMKKAGSDAIRQNAKLVIVEFGTEYRQIRQIKHLRSDLNKANIPVEVLPAESAMVEGKWFVPHEHFLRWRQKEAEVRPQLLMQAAATLAEIIRDLGPGGDRRHEDISTQLNRRGILTPTGRAWTADNVRKVIKRGTWKGLSSEPER